MTTVLICVQSSTDSALIVRPDPLCLSEAARTAASMSRGPLRGTRSSTSPVAGLMTSIVSPLAAGTHCPAMSCVPSVSRELGSTTVSGPADAVLVIIPPPGPGHTIYDTFDDEKRVI